MTESVGKSPIKPQLIELKTQVDKSRPEAEIACKVLREANENIPPGHGLQEQRTITQEAPSQLDEEEITKLVSNALQSEFKTLADALYMRSKYLLAYQKNLDLGRRSLLEEMNANPTNFELEVKRVGTFTIGKDSINTAPFTEQKAVLFIRDRLLRYIKSERPMFSIDKPTLNELLYTLSPSFLVPFTAKENTFIENGWMHDIEGRKELSCSIEMGKDDEVQITRQIKKQFLFQEKAYPYTGELTIRYNLKTAEVHFDYSVTLDKIHDTWTTKEPLKEFPTTAA
jgi:hypothetical protein